MRALHRLQAKEVLHTAATACECDEKVAVEALAVVVLRVRFQWQRLVATTDVTTRPATGWSSRVTLGGSL